MNNFEYTNLEGGLTIVKAGQDTNYMKKCIDCDFVRVLDHVGTKTKFMLVLIT